MMLDAFSEAKFLKARVASYTPRPIESLGSAADHGGELIDAGK